MVETGARDDSDKTSDRNMYRDDKSTGNVYRNGKRDKKRIKEMEGVVTCV